MDSPFIRLLTDDARKQFDQDIASFRGSRIVHNFPFDEKGRLKLKTSVLLRAYTTTAAPGRFRDVCLAAVGPEHRSDEQSIQIKLCDMIIVNQSHNWQANTWLWLDTPAPDWETWGANSIDEIDPNTNPEHHAAMRSVSLLDEGKIEEALGIYGVTFSEDIHRLLGGQRISPPACCAKPDEKWTELLVATLRQSGPGLFPKAAAAVKDMEPWRDPKKRKFRSISEFKLVIFPGQIHIDKACLFLTYDLCLKIFSTGSNFRLHDTAWKRSINFDLRRYGILPSPDNSK